MSDWEINIKPSGVSIKTQRVKTLYDENGESVQVPDGGPHRTALAVGDFETVELFTEHVEGLLSGKYGAMIEHVVNASAIERDANDALTRDNEGLTVMIDEASGLMTKATDKIAELSTQHATLNDSIMQLGKEKDALTEEIRILKLPTQEG